MKIKMLSKKLLIVIALTVSLSTPTYAEEATSSEQELPSELQTLKESYPVIQSEEEMTTYVDTLYPDFEVVNFSDDASNCTISKNPNTSQFEATIQYDNATEVIPLQTNKVVFVENAHFCDSYTIDSSVQGLTFAIMPYLYEHTIIDQSPIVLESGAEATLEVNNYLNIVTETYGFNESSGNIPAITVPEGADLTISGSGFLDCEIYDSFDHYSTDNEGTGLAAAIGTAGHGSTTGQHSTSNCGNITIKDGVTVYASSARGPGIGSGAIYGSTCNQYSGDCGNIVIQNATVFTECFDGYSPGIGAGGVNARSCSAYAGDTSTISIINSTVIANGGSYAPAIGAGGACSGSLDAHGGDNGTINVTNSDIYSIANEDNIFGGGGAKAPFNYSGKDGTIDIDENSTIHPNSNYYF